MVTYFGNSTVCTIAVYITLVPRARQLEELSVDHVSSFIESELFVCSITSLQTVDSCKDINKVFDTQ